MDPYRHQVLDHGYVHLVESWGSDEAIIEAARMSTDGGFRAWNDHYACRACGCLWRKNDDQSISLYDKAQKPCRECDNNPDFLSVAKWTHGDARLLRYLYTHGHMTPFEMAGVVIEVKAPIFVFREWHRHRTQSYNEMSARYIPLPDENYIPSVERIVAGTTQTAPNRQAAGLAPLDESKIADWLINLEQAHSIAQAVYQEGLAAGIPKELARLAVPVARYSRMRASANLRNWLQFLELRLAPNAQWEIRQYADAVSAIIGELFPRTHLLFLEKWT